MSYLKDLPCETCGTEITYYFPKKPTERYCYCSFRDEVGEQIAREIEELAPKLLARWIEAGDSWVESWNYLDEENAQRIVEFIAAAIARGEK